MKYTVTDQEQLAIFNACKYFKQMIHGSNITVHTNHKKLTFNTSQQATTLTEWILIQL